MVTASSATVCKYFCSIEEVKKCQAAVFLAPDSCYFITGLNFQINSDDAKKLEGHITDTNIFYHISSDDSVVPQKHEKIEKVILLYPLPKPSLKIGTTHAAHSDNFYFYFF